MTANALIGLDLPVIMGTVIYGAFFIVYLDPRLRPQ